MPQKQADISGSITNPNSYKAPSMDGIPTTLPTASKVKSVIKTSSAPLPEDEVGNHAEGVSIKGENPEKLPQQSLRVLRPYVDVSNKEPKAEAEKKASAYNYALGDRYPIDTIPQVKTASSYFMTYSSRFTADERREFSANLVKRASDLGLVRTLPDEIRKWAGTKLASQSELEFSFFTRKRACEGNEEAVQLLDKIASQIPYLHPEGLAAVLIEFDNKYMLTSKYASGMHDPYYTTYGIDKTAAEEYREMINGDLVTGDKLEKGRYVLRQALVDIFGEDFATEFGKHPVEQFKALPLAQKKVVSRLLNDNAPGGTGV